MPNENEWTTAITKRQKTQAKSSIFVRYPYWCVYTGIKSSRKHNCEKIKVNVKQLKGFLSIEQTNIHFPQKNLGQAFLVFCCFATISNNTVIRLPNASDGCTVPHRWDSVIRGRWDSSKHFIHWKRGKNVVFLISVTADKLIKRFSNSWWKGEPCFDDGLSFYVAGL